MCSISMPDHVAWFCSFPLNNAARMLAVVTYTPLSQCLVPWYIIQINSTAVAPNVLDPRDAIARASTIPFPKHLRKCNVRKNAFQGSQSISPKYKILLYSHVKVALLAFTYSSLVWLPFWRSLQRRNEETSLIAFLILDPTTRANFGHAHLQLRKNQWAFLTS